MGNTKNGNGNGNDRRVANLTIAVIVLGVLLLLFSSIVGIVLWQYRPIIADIYQVKQDVDKLRDDYNSVVAEAQGLKAEKEKLEKDLLSKSDELAKANNDIANKNAQIGSLAKQIGVKDSQNKALVADNKALKSLKNDYDGVVKARDALLIEKNAWLSQAEDNQVLMANLQQEKIGLEKDLAGLKAEMEIPKGAVVAKSGSDELRKLQQEINLSRAEEAFIDAASLVAHAPPNDDIQGEVLKLLTEVKNTAAWFLTKGANQTHKKRFEIARQMVEKIKQLKDTKADTFQHLPESHRKSLLSLEKRWQDWQKLRI